jgi:hypothetical protein
MWMLASSHPLGCHHLSLVLPSPWNWKVFELEVLSFWTFASLSFVVKLKDNKYKYKNTEF